MAQARKGDPVSQLQYLISAMQKIRRIADAIRLID
jgi:hypothetical protein